MCEAFACVPSVAIQEMETLPFGLIESIVQLRTYRDLYRDKDAAERRNDTKTLEDPRFAVVIDIEYELARARQAARIAARGDV